MGRICGRGAKPADQLRTTKHDAVPLSGRWKPRGIGSASKITIKP